MFCLPLFGSTPRQVLMLDTSFLRSFHGRFARVELKQKIQHRMIQIYIYNYNYIYIYIHMNL